MTFQRFSSQYPPGPIKQEDHALALYATTPIQDIGVVRQTSYYPEAHVRGLEYRPATTTAFSGAFGRVVEMPQKRSSPGEANGHPSKQIKTEQPEEFSNAVKKKLQSSTRTGQACDRCKVSHRSVNRLPPTHPLSLRRSERLDAMAFQEDVPLVCRIIPTAEQQIASQVELLHEVTLRDWSNKTATCNIEFANWSKDWFKEVRISSHQAITMMWQLRIMTTVKHLQGSLLLGPQQQLLIPHPITMAVL